MPDADPGLFGPDSITWNVHADPLMPVAGLRALLMQAVHPLAMAGVSQHSAFRADPWGRLARTAEYIGVTTFATTSEAAAAAARVRGVHRHKSGVEPESGDGYTVDDPALLRWVHCCLVDSFLSVVTRGGLHLYRDEADAYVQEQTRAAALVGLDPGSVPSSRAQLRRYFEEVRPELRVTAAAREAAVLVIAPPMPTAVALATPARPVWAGAAGLAFAALPAWARRLYSLPPLPGTDALHEAGTTASLRVLRTGLRGLQSVVPPLREGPHLSEARRRLQS